MSERVKLVDPKTLKRNPENPRLIFHEDELLSLQDSISKQGILVPLTVYQDKRSLFLLDGERRWLCSLKLGLSTVPVIIQPKPDKMQNLMMMFAIHNARKDWDPLPTALKLEVLEKEFEKRNERMPNEVELSGLASLRRGEVRRLKTLLSLPQKYRNDLLDELKKPRSEQQITVDHVLETTNATEALSKRKVINESEVEQLRQAIIKKFRSKVIKNTVDPRKLSRMARAVDRNEISPQSLKTALGKLIKTPQYSIDDAFRETVEKTDFEHSVEQLANRLIEKLKEHKSRNYEISESLKDCLNQLVELISKTLIE